MDYRRSVIAQNQSVAASSVTTFDLPVNPLSHLIFTLKGLNVTDEATLAEILARVSRFEVTRFGQSIYAMSGADLWALNAVMMRNMPILFNQIATDNAARAISLVIPFGRKLYNPNEGMPGTSRGELKLQVTMSATETAIDGMILQIEAVEMIGASPKNFVKATTISLTTVSGIENAIDLPIGNKLASLLMFSTTVPATTAFTATISKIRFLFNNIERNIAAANWESLHGDLLARLGHREAYDGSADNDDLYQYALADFSPNDDDTFVVETKGASSVVLGVTAGDAAAIRVIPVELVAA